MANRQLRYETVTSLLKEVLFKLMAEPLFTPFHLVGGTNLSLRYGHRLSIDIDLFSDAPYGSLDFRSFESFLKEHFPYYKRNTNTSFIGPGKSYDIGNTRDECIKLDLMYADPFLEEAEMLDCIRMAGIKDIIAMKIDTVARGGRKKDFWDLHLLLNEYSLDEMLALHAQRYEWTHNTQEILKKFTDFSEAENQPDPMCLLNKDWDIIKLDLIDTVQDYNKQP
ncbi:MAG: nucleotidyl transferase AbiEii/AbiGii toxin family protein [Bacteroides sp.]|nr:nucleotidyl transferase AbiEii/AbiGii toxin family protein [Bacteroides sp.]